MTYSIRPLTINDLSEYKSLRLYALKTEPAFFRSSYREEAVFLREHWAQRLTNPKGTIFGLFHFAELIGITAIMIEDEGHGYLTHSYIRPQHRRQNLSTLLFQTRINWAKDRKLKKLVVNHRKSNLASKAAIIKAGFRFTHAENTVWPDGSNDDFLNYELLF